MPDAFKILCCSKSIFVEKCHNKHFKLAKTFSHYNFALISALTIFNLCAKNHLAHNTVLLPHYVVFNDYVDYVDSFYFMPFSFCYRLLSMLMLLCMSIPVSIVPQFTTLAPGGVSHVKTLDPFRGIPQSELGGQNP